MKSPWGRSSNVTGSCSAIVFEQGDNDRWRRQRRPRIRHFPPRQSRWGCKWDDKFAAVPHIKRDEEENITTTAGGPPFRPSKLGVIFKTCQIYTEFISLFDSAQHEILTVARSLLPYASSSASVALHGTRYYRVKLNLPRKDLRISSSKLSYLNEISTAY